MTAHVTITPDGHLELPTELRLALGLPDGGTVLVEETDDGLVLRSVRQSVERARAILRESGGDWEGASVDEFLRNRRAEWGE